MTTKFSGDVQFDSLSIVDGTFGTGTISLASVIQYSITNFSAADRALSATESGAANIAASLATLISDLAKKGIISSTGGE